MLDLNRIFMRKSYNYIYSIMGPRPNCKEKKQMRAVDKREKKH